MDPKAKPAAVLFLFALLCTLLRLHCSGWSLLRSTSQLRSETLGRGEPSYGFQPLPKGVPVLQLALSFCLLLNDTNASNATKAKSSDSSDSSDSEFFKDLSCILVLWSSTVRALAVGRVLLWSILNPLPSFKKTARLTGWQGHFLSCEYHKDCPLCILNISQSHNEVHPEFGLFQVMDRLEDGCGCALPLFFVCQQVGLVLHGAQSPELGGPAMEGPSSNERCLGGLRKRLVLFEPCPPGLTDAAEVTEFVQKMKRYKGHWAFRSFSWALHGAFKGVLNVV